VNILQNILQVNATLGIQTADLDNRLNETWDKIQNLLMIFLDDCLMKIQQLLYLRHLKKHGLDYFVQEYPKMSAWIFGTQTSEHDVHVFNGVDLEIFSYCS